MKWNTNKTAGIYETEDGKFTIRKNWTTETYSLYSRGKQVLANNVELLGDKARQECGAVGFGRLRDAKEFVISLYK